MSTRYSNLSVEDLYDHRAINLTTEEEKYKPIRSHAVQAGVSFLQMGHQATIQHKVNGEWIDDETANNQMRDRYAKVSDKPVKARNVSWKNHLSTLSNATRALQNKSELFDQDKQTFAQIVATTLVGIGIDYEDLEQAYQEALQNEVLG